MFQRLGSRKVLVYLGPEQLLALAIFLTCTIGIRLEAGEGTRKTDSQGFRSAVGRGWGGDITFESQHKVVQSILILPVRFLVVLFGIFIDSSLHKLKGALPEPRRKIYPLVAVVGQATTRTHIQVV